MTLPVPDPQTRLRQARRALLTQGQVPVGMLTPELARSWQRSRDAGIAPDSAPRDGDLRRGEALRQALEQSGEFLAHARPVLAFVQDQIRDSGDLVLLSDHDGLLLHALGEARFLAKAERVALMPGACWSERQRGTNAIGTALAEVAATTIHAGEHFLDENGFLTCAAAPIVDSRGRVRGVIDISGEQSGRHPHTLALVRTAARMIEESLFATAHARHARLHLHPAIEGLGTVGAGLLALTEDGWVVGANGQARHWLGLRERDLGACTVAALLGIDAADLLAGAGRHRRLLLPDHRACWSRLELPGRRGGIVGAVADAAPPVPATAIAPAPDGEDPRLAELRHRASRALAAGLPLLLHGESGTGKDVFARELHRHGPRRDGPFVAVDCAALPDTLIEAELFGYQGGAFTGARREGAKGHFRAADGGTLLLDEIGDMPLPLQTRLLRVIEERCVRPLGAAQPVPIDVQWIGATHRDLRLAVAQGTFRADLFHRLNGLSLTLPPLRERSDFDTLCRRLLREIRPQQPTAVAAEVAALLRRCAWPGNVRQLRNVLTSAAAMLEADEQLLRPEHLPDDVRVPPPSATAPIATGTGVGDANLRRLSARTIADVLAATGHNVSEAARRLGISRNTLYRHLRTVDRDPA
jgi:transcriptional regulator of acetoin/glycerol metabolism